jgi:hypothetical protein
VITWNKSLSSHGVRDESLRAEQHLYIEVLQLFTELIARPPNAML